MKNFLIFYKGNQPLIAIPVNCSLKISYQAVSCLPSYTIIRKLFKLYLYFKIFIYHSMKKHFNIKNTFTIPNCVENWFFDFQKKIDNKFYPVIIWSLVENRKRFYIHLINEKGEKEYFVKFVENEEDFQLLQNERNKLEYYQNAKTFTVPALIDYEEKDTYTTLVTSYLQKYASLYHPERNPLPEKIIKEININVINMPMKNIRKLDWYQIKFSKHREMFKFFHYINNINNDKQIKLCNIHGDFGSENIFKLKNGQFIVIDWERSINNGPYLTDRIAYWLGANHQNIKRDSKKMYEKLLIDFKNFNLEDIALALLYLVNVKFDLAIKIAKEWKE